MFLQHVWSTSHSCILVIQNAIINHNAPINWMNTKLVGIISRTQIDPNIQYSFIFHPSYPNTDLRIILFVHRINHESNMRLENNQLLVWLFRGWLDLFVANVARPCIHTAKWYFNWQPLWNCGSYFGISKYIAYIKIDVHINFTQNIIKYKPKNIGIIGTALTISNLETK